MKAFPSAERFRRAMSTMPERVIGGRAQGRGGTPNPEGAVPGKQKRRRIKMRIEDVVCFRRVRLARRV